MSAPEVVWLGNSLIHYHRARADAFARDWPGQFTLLELCGRDQLSILESETCAFARVRTLFPGITVADLRPRAVSESVRGYLEENRPGVCCLNGWALPGSAAMLHWALERGVPCVIMSESNAHDSPSVWWKETTKRRFVAQCRAAFVGGLWHRNYLVELGMDPACIFEGYDVVDNEHFRLGAESARRGPLGTRAALGLPRQYFVACARFEAKKNLPRLIEAHAIYLQKAGREGWSLLIVGDGPMRADLETLAAKLGSKEKVVFAGWRTYQQLPAIYGLGKAFIHASTTEQWGLVVNEAMAAGLPVLVSERSGCAAELVKPGENGFTFDPWNIEEIAGTMLSIHLDDHLREQMGKRSLEIIAHWGPERFARGLRQAVECAMNRGSHDASLVSRMMVRLMTVR